MAITANELDRLVFSLPSDGSCSNYPFQIQQNGMALLTVTNNNATQGDIIWNVAAGSAGVYNYICTTQPSVTNTITILGVPAGGPTSFTATPLTASSATLSWDIAVLNNCSFANWSIMYSLPSPVTGPVAGCTDLLSTSSSCVATGLLPDASYAFSAQIMCSNAGVNSAIAVSRQIFVTPAAMTSVMAVVLTATSVQLNWGAVAGACAQLSYSVTVLPTGIPAQGCSSMGSSQSCVATGLLPNTAYSFSVATSCQNGQSFASSPMSSSDITTEAAVIFNVTCPDTTAFRLNGVANPTLTVWQGDSIVFFFDPQCGAPPYSFQVNVASTTGMLADASAAYLEVDTSSSSSVVGYSSGGASMMGSINVVPKPTRASTPGVPTVSEVTGLPDLLVSWTPGNPGDCVFASWSVQLAGGGAVAGCMNLTAMTNTSCVATNLNGSTSYSFTVQRICTSSLANSDISAASAAQTTISTAGLVVCQNTDTCNCGNATLCTCQLTKTCNCQNSQKCICQGGTCNGGNTGMLICNLPTGCNKQCAAGCIGCLDIGSVSSFLGGGSKSTCVNDAVMASASGALLVFSFLII